MANWNNLGSRRSVEDRRGFAPRAVGGLGLGGLAVYLLFTYLSGGSIDPGTVVNSLENLQVQEQTVDPAAFAGADSYEIFASTVLGSTNDTWTNLFSQMNRTYDPPKLVLFRTATDSACGGAYSEAGPHYCPPDDTIYLDETFFDELQSRFGGSSGDVAQAYVIAHEVGHHVQNELGIMDDADFLKERGFDESDISVKLELQADCFAGLWAYSIKDRGVFEPNEIQEALSAAAAVGDDHIQEVEGMRINRDTFTHGSSAERTTWFTRGYESGTLSACDTFNS